MPERVAIILADGRSKKQHMDNPYAIEVAGRTLLTRTVQQFAAHVPVIVVTNNDETWDLVRAQRNIARHKPVTDVYEWKFGGLAMIPKALDRAWSPESIVIFGDVWFTQDAVDIIMAPRVGTDWNVYGRSTDNPYTGTPWAEWFAFRTTWASRKAMHRAAIEVTKKLQAGEIRRGSPWEWYFHLEGMDINEVHSKWDPKSIPTGRHWVEINDLTDDIDFPQDAENIERAVQRR